MRLVKKVLGKVLQSHIIAVRTALRGQGHMGGAEVRVGPAAEGGIGSLLAVLAQPRGGCGRRGGRVRRGGGGTLGGSEGLASGDGAGSA